MEENQVSIDYNWLGKMYRPQATPQFHMKLQNDYVYANECFAKIASDHVDDSVVSDVPLNVEMGENINQEEEPTNSEKDTAGDSVYGDENSQDFVNADEVVDYTIKTMDRIESFMKTYNRCLETERGHELMQLFDRVAIHFKSLSLNERVIAFTKLFADGTGLLSFLRNTIDGRKLPTTFGANTYLTAFNLLKFLIQEFPEEFRPYAVPTMALCIAVLKGSSHYNFYKAAYDLSVMLIERFFLPKWKVPVNSKL